MLCMPVFLAVRWKTILAWDSTSHGGKMPEGYLHLTLAYPVVTHSH